MIKELLGSSTGMILSDRCIITKGLGKHGQNINASGTPAIEKLGTSIVASGKPAIKRQ